MSEQIEEVEVLTVRESLKLWRSERNLTPMKAEPGLIGNLMEEATEVARAKTLEDVVDGILDYLVYLTNVIPEVEMDAKIPERDLLAILQAPNMEFAKEVKDRMFEAEHELIGKYKIVHFLNEFTNSVAIYLSQRKDTTRTLGEYFLDSFNNNVLFLYGIIKVLGYDYEQCIQECLKAIHSRKGSWDDNLQKFVKDPDQTDVYKPDYKQFQLA